MMEHIKEILEALPGVQFAHVTTNWTAKHDKKTGLPPYSVKVYVLGGKKKQIAQVIWMNKLIGTMLLGNTQTYAECCAGYKWPVTFERLL